MQSGRSRGQSGASLPKPLPRLGDAGPKQIVNVDDADRPAVLNHEFPFIVPIVVDEGRCASPHLSLGRQRRFWRDTSRHTAATGLCCGGTATPRQSRRTPHGRLAWRAHAWRCPRNKPSTESTGDAMLHCEIRSHLVGLKSGDRVAFIDAHASEVAAAVLSAPSFLSGFTTAELGVVCQRIEAHNPAIASAKAETMKALEQCESGWRNAVREIRCRGGLEIAHDRVAQRAGTSMNDV